MILLMAAGGGTVSPPADPRPVIADPLVMQMRPTGRSLRTIRIARDGSGEFTTFKAAIAAGTATQNAAVAAAGLVKPTPNFWITYLVGPGVYQPGSEFGSGEIHPFAAFYALDPTKGATRVEWGMEPTGGFYWEGIDVTCVDNAGAFDPKYAFHLHALATIVLTRCAFTNAAPSAGGYPMPIGMDGDTGCTLVCHDVDFTTGPRLSNHGLIGGTGSLAGMTIVYSQCRYPTGSLYFSTLNDSDLTEMWVVGGSADACSLVGDKATLHLDPATVLNRTTGSYAGHVKADGSPATGVTDARTDWPVPVGGLSQADRDHYGM